MLFLKSNRIGRNAYRVLRVWNDWIYEQMQHCRRGKKVFHWYVALSGLLVLYTEVKALNITLLVIFE